MRQISSRAFCFGLMLTTLGLTSPHVSFASEAWREAWAVTKGFALEAHASGFELPVSIVMVPEPGSAPTDPLYFVTELKGRIKVVTRDRAVHVFAENFFRREVEHELPFHEGELGLTGLCLAPQQGFVFATFAYADEQGQVRNDMVRFSATPKSFGLKPTGEAKRYTSLFSGYTTGVSTQIAGCVVRDGLLYVSVGDGQQPQQASVNDSLLGKILRMTFDGEPVADNPYFDAHTPTVASQWIYASGLRNAFGLVFVNDQLFATDNGAHNVDRFLRVERGANYLHDGSAMSFGLNVQSALPNFGITAIDFGAHLKDGMPEIYRGHFFVVVTGNLQYLPAPEQRHPPRILSFPYDFSKQRMTEVPRAIAQYRGSGLQTAVGLALGEGGLYFNGIYPDADGNSSILRLYWDVDHPHPHAIEDEMDPQELMRTAGCVGCHSIGPEQGSKVGPSLAQAVLLPRLEALLETSVYQKRIATLDATEPGQVAMRKDVLAVEGRARMARWVQSRILDPKFDQPDAKMPTMNLSAKQAARIAEHLVPGERDKGAVANMIAGVSSLIPFELKRRHLAIGVGSGFIAGVLLGGLVARRLWRSKARANG